MRYQVFDANLHLVIGYRDLRVAKRIARAKSKNEKAAVFYVIDIYTRQAQAQYLDNEEQWLDNNVKDFCKKLGSDNS